MDSMTLQARAEELAPLLILTAETETNSLFDVLERTKKLDVKKESLLEKFRVNREIKAQRKRFIGTVKHEVLWFVFHLTERFTFDFLTAEERRLFLHALSGAICRRLLVIFPPEIVNQWPRICAARSEEYSKYSNLVAKEPPLQDTLSWEFTQRIMGIFREEWDICIFMVLQAQCVETMALVWTSLLAFFESDFPPDLSDP